MRQQINSEKSYTKSMFDNYLENGLTFFIISSVVTLILASIIDRICALRNGASRDWWLRTPDEESGITSAYVALITADGGSCKPYAELANEGFCDESLCYDDYDYGIFDHAVRPAIYLKTK